MSLGKKKKSTQTSHTIKPLASKNKGKKHSHGYLSKNIKSTVRERKLDYPDTLTTFHGKRQYSKTLMMPEQR